MTLGAFRALTEKLPETAMIGYLASDEKGRTCWSGYTHVEVRPNPFDSTDLCVIMTPGTDYDNREAGLLDNLEEGAR